MARVVFEPATAADDGALRRLMADNAMDGRIRIAFEREPSYFHAVAVQGHVAQVVVGRDVETGTLVGVGTRVITRAFVNGEPRSVGYLGDLRLLPSYRGRTLVARGYRLLRELHRDGQTDLYFTAIAAENRLALDTIASGRAGLPAYRDLGLFHSPAVNLLGPRPAIDAAGIEIVRGHPGMLDAIVACLNDHGRAKQFAPVYTAEDFAAATPRFRDFRIEDFYVALRGSRVVGTLARWDQGAFKQTRVVGYRGALRVLRPLVNLGAPALGLPRFPRAGDHLRSFHAAFASVQHNDLDVFRALLRRLYNDAVCGTDTSVRSGTSRERGGHASFVIGLHARDPLAVALREYRCSPFQGRLFCVHFEGGEDAYRWLDGRVPHVEPATL